jgi:putative ABC transport system permease protein
MLSKARSFDLSRPRWRKVIADLWESKTRTLLVVASIAAGVFAVGTLTAAYSIMSKDINVSYAAIRPFNIDITTTGFYEDFARQISQVPGVDKVEGRRIFNVRTKTGDDNWESLTLIGVQDLDNFQINLLSLVEGNLSPKSGEILVSQDFIRNAGYVLGDRVEIEFPAGETHFYSVAGIVTDMANSGPTYQTSANVYLSIDDLDQAGYGTFFNRLIATVDGAGDDEKFIDQVSANVRDKVERNGRPVFRINTGLTTEHPMASSVLAILGVLAALATLITLLSSSLIFNTLNALLVQHKRQIGVMILVGGQKRQILGMYIALIIAYSLISLAITVPLGAIAGYVFSEFMATLLGATIQGFRVIPLAVILQVIIAILVPLGAGYFPVDRATKVDVRTALSTDTSASASAGIDRLNQLTSRFKRVPRPILLSIRNTFRRTGRLILTVFTLTMAGGVFIAVFNVRSSMENLMSELMEHFLGDLTVSFSQPYPISRVRQILLPIPGVEEIEGWGGIGGEIWTNNDELVSNIAISSAPSDTQLLDPEIVAGRWLFSNERNALVISDSIYDTYPDLVPGDFLRIKLPGERVEDWEVVGIFRFISMLGDPLAYADFNVLASIFNTQNMATSYRVITTEHDIEFQESLSGYINDLLVERGFKVGAVVGGESLREERSQGINILVIMLLIMAILTAFVGSIGLTGTMGMNVIERTREIGVMRAIGAVDFRVLQSVVIEALVIGVITWILAIFLSFPISLLLLQIIGAAMLGSSPTLIFTPLGIFIWLIVVAILSVIASILPARNAVRLTINEVLSYE